MKKAFDAYLQPTEAQIAALWKDALITIDANVLLNLYRYRPSTRAELLALLKSLTHRLWLPHQAGLEFFQNREGVVATERKRSTEPLAEFRKVLATLDSRQGHPFVSPGLRKALATIEKRLEKELKANADNVRALEKDDQILSDVMAIFAGRVGEPFSPPEMAHVATEGEERYRQQVPPGFEDRKKDREHRRYGDLILWRQVLAEAKRRESSVIFVTDDSKADWWLKTDGRMSPHPHLRQEFAREIGAEFYMYPAEGFMSGAAKHLKRPITKEAIEEVKDTRDHLERARHALEETRKLVSAPATAVNSAPLYVSTSTGTLHPINLPTMGAGGFAVGMASGPHLRSTGLDDSFLQYLANADAERAKSVLREWLNIGLAEGDSPTTSPEGEKRKNFDLA
jgi:PIN domain-containing protein